MKILAHRGLWKKSDERNTLEALTKAIDEGFGIETDIRDYKGRLVISHDIATENSPLVEDFFRHYSKSEKKGFLALNVKADGIQKLLFELIEQYDIDNYAVFDMSIPEMVVYKKQGFKFLSRQSEIENEIIYYEMADGVWMDEWEEPWISKEGICNHISNGKKVGIISPEIHGRDSLRLWKELEDIKSDNLMLCTDRASEAREFFDGKKN